MKPIKEVCLCKKCSYLYDFGGPEDEALHCGADSMVAFGNAATARNLAMLQELPSNCLYKFEQSVAAAENKKCS